MRPWKTAWFLCLALASCAPSTEPGAELCSVAAELRVCAPGATLPGLDVSKWDGVIDWPQVAASGQKFAIARISDGLTYPDATFDANWRGAKAAGVVRGSYQFFRPGQDPTAQADLVLRYLQQGGGLEPTDLPPVLDIESSDNLSDATVRARMKIWLARIEQRTGRRPIIYTAYFMTNVLGTEFSAYPLWVANYGVSCPLMPNGWSTWTFWQYSDKGRVPGINAAADMNHFNGTRADLEVFIRSTVLDAGASLDAGQVADAGRVDAGVVDAGARSDGGGPPDAGPAQAADAGSDGGDEHRAGAGNSSPVIPTCSP